MGVIERSSVEILLKFAGLWFKLVELIGLDEIWALDSSWNKIHLILFQEVDFGKSKVLPRQFFKEAMLMSADVTLDTGLLAIINDT